MAGRNRKPTHLKIVEGNKGKRAINGQEPDPDYLNDLTPPEFLTDSAKVVWEEIAQNLRDARVLTVLDIPMLQMVCESVATYRNAVKKCEERHAKGSIGESSSIGYWEMIKSMSFKQAMAAMQQFGMSPAARTRIAIQPQGELDLGDKESKNYFT
ncbi:phage terminase small subunit P27 family [Nitrosomonas communis]|uniref:Phage terminase, small subunit, putative, P27 family n=1 Tax=Nitrosomonas communis TaxID=44574 RepID=A0A1I4XB64_9PROT|nr:phage terminase small subunit P27 family [Nitrosomonas communis]SFN23137.1 phage terminase, small subunit, putative, P27 family [Nitrosomonas communis]